MVTATLDVNIILVLLPFIACALAVASDYVQLAGQAHDPVYIYEMHLSSNQLQCFSIWFFQMQGICKEDEWDEFIAALRRDLPATFRITGYKGEAKKMLDIIQGQFIKECLKQNADSENSPNIAPLPW